MEIRNWNEIVKNGIRIEIEFFFKMEITLVSLCHIDMNMMWWLILSVLFVFHWHFTLMQIYAPTGPVTRDYDDVRRFQEAGEKALKRWHTYSWIFVCEM